jgi:hypothetical protein
VRAKVPHHLVLRERRVTRIGTQKEETMTTSVIEAPTTGNGSQASLGGGDGELLLLFARYSGRESAQRRALEDAVLEAEDILTQAEEANALDPVG